MFILSCGPVSQAPPRPSPGAILGATLAAMTALCALVLLGVLSGHLLLIPPMAASMALVAGAPSLPLAQPRSVVVGQVASALVGLGFGALGHSLWIAALAGGVGAGGDACSAGVPLASGGDGGHRGPRS